MHTNATDIAAVECPDGKEKRSIGLCHEDKAGDAARRTWPSYRPG
ncbi:MAG: hypothetical protein NVSMB53_20110 [Gemmatimonadaceae bacterium]